MSSKVILWFWNVMLALGIVTSNVRHCNIYIGLFQSDIVYVRSIKDLYPIRTLEKLVSCWIKWWTSQWIPIDGQKLISFSQEVSEGSRWHCAILVLWDLHLQIVLLIWKEEKGITVYFLSKCWFLQLDSFVNLYSRDDVKELCVPGTGAAKLIISPLTGIFCFSRWCSPRSWLKISLEHILQNSSRTYLLSSALMDHWEGPWILV